MCRGRGGGRMSDTWDFSKNMLRVKCGKERRQGEYPNITEILHVLCMCVCVCVCARCGAGGEIT